MDESGDGKLGSHEIKVGYDKVQRKSKDYDKILITEEDAEKIIGNHGIKYFKILKFPDNTTPE